MIGRSVIFYDELGSTNDFIKTNFRDMDHGTIIVANTQTKGRGRRDNLWESKVGNLYFSILLKNNICREDIFKYIVCSSMSIVSVINKCHIDCKIKYPNDILINSKKVSGVLIESSGGKKLDYIVIGIGINVNQLDFNSLNDYATSLKKTTGKNFDLNQVLKDFIKEMNKYIFDDYKTVFIDYLKYSMVLKKEILFNNEKYTISEIESNGMIIIKNDVNELKVSSNEISLKELY